MHRCTITKLTLPLFVMLFVVSLSSVKGQGLQSELAQRVKAFDSESASTVVQLVDFAQRFQIPMGIELANESEESVAPPIHARNTTAQRIIQQIVHERPGTGFTLSGGVLHVFATSIVNDHRNFLNLRMSHFQVENESLFGAEWLLRVSIHQVLSPSPGEEAMQEDIVMAYRELTPLMSVISVFPLTMQPSGRFSTVSWRGRAMLCGSFALTHRR